MAYQVADLTPGMVILCQPNPHEPLPNRMLDWAIARSSGPFIHACYVGHRHLIEQLRHVQTSPLAKYADTGWAFTIRGMTPDLADGMIRWGLQHLDQPYGVKALLEDGLLLDLHDWHALSDDPQFPTCSGLVERASRHGAGIPLTEMPLPSPTALAFSPNLIGPRPWQQSA